MPGKPQQNRMFMKSASDPYAKGFNRIKALLAGSGLRIQGYSKSTEADFLDVIGTEVLRVFLLQFTVTSSKGTTPPPVPPPPLSKSGLKPGL